MITRRRIRTVIVDDSAVARQLLHWILTEAGDFEVIDTVADGERAIERVALLRPDLVTMDLHLPGLQGLEVTRQIMQRSPVPIAIVAASTNIDDATIFQALAAGALTAVQRPHSPGQPDYLRRRRRLLGELRTAAGAGFADARRTPAQTRGAALRPGTAAEALPPRAAPGQGGNPAVAVIAIAASTGGPQALRVLLCGLPPGLLPPILIVQHIADGFTEGLVGWLGSFAPGAVAIAVDGEQLTGGTILVAPNHQHLTVTPAGRVRLVASPPIDGHRPSASVLFESIADSIGPRAIGILLTGMGSDGARGLLRLHQAGGATVAEDPATAVVGSMPGAAIALGGVDRVLPLAGIGPFLTTLLRQPRPSPATNHSDRRSMT